MADEFYVECFLERHDGLTKLAELACDRDVPSQKALAANLAKMYRVEDSDRIQLTLRQATPSDVAAVTDLLRATDNPSLQAAWADAAVRLASGTQTTQFNSEDCAPAEWVEAIESARIGNARWRDASWGNNAAPSWELFDGNQVLTEAFYYTADNAERFTEHHEEQSYIQVLVFDDDEGTVGGFETSPGAFLSMIEDAAALSSSPREALGETAERACDSGMAFWSKSL
jgi:hypothetical protein